MKRLHGAVLGIVGLALSGAALAEGMNGSSERKVDSAQSVTSKDISKDHKVSDLTGMPVHNRQDEKLGSISDLVIDRDGKVSNVVLHEGGVAGLGGNRYLVPWDRVQFTPGEKVAIIDVTRDQLSSEFAALEESDKAKEEESKKSEESGKPSATSPPARTGE